MKIIDKIVKKYCKHRKISCTYVYVSEHTYYEHQHCHKCHKNRKILNSCGCKIVGDWD